jgi:hypothetical protein
MRNLVLSVGITFLTGTLLFVYFRNKINNIDRKVNLVFETIKEYNSKMEQENDIEMRKFAAMQEHLRNQFVEQQPQPGEGNPEISEELNEVTNTKLIDVSDKELGEFDNSDEDSDDENTSSEEDSDDSDDEEENKLNIVSEEIVEETKLEVTNVKEDLEEKQIVDSTDYAKFTKNQLKNICEERELTGYKSLNKTKLIELLQSK